MLKDFLEKKKYQGEKKKEMACRPRWPTALKRLKKPQAFLMFFSFFLWDGSLHKRKAPAWILATMVVTRKLKVIVLPKNLFSIYFHLETPIKPKKPINQPKTPRRPKNKKN